MIISFRCSLRSLRLCGNNFFYHTNNLYNVRALTDEAGEIVERYRYSAYGEVTILDPNDQEIFESSVGNVYMFQGRRFDAETGLYYYRNRFMSAELGRFLQRDPLGYVDGWNLYAYVRNSPTVYVDPKGLMPELDACIAGCYERYPHRYQAIQLLVCMRECERIYPSPEPPEPDIPDPFAERYPIGVSHFMRFLANTDWDLERAGVVCFSPFWPLAAHNELICWQHCPEYDMIGWGFVRTLHCEHVITISCDEWYQIIDPPGRML